MYFRQAYDMVWHDGLLYKLLKYDISGKMYDIIRDMYCGGNDTIETKRWTVRLYNSKQWPKTRV